MNLKSLSLLAFFFLFQVSADLSAQTTPDRSSLKVYPIAIVIHGGAGYMSRDNIAPEMEKAYHHSLQLALKTGYEVLEKGGSSLDAVEATIRILENDSLFNAGKGAVLTAEGKAELDASIMDGKSMKAGAVAGVTTIKNPISAARKVMEESPHVLLAGKGAEVFAKSRGLEIIDNAYFITEPRRADWERAQQKEREGNKQKGGGGWIEPDPTGGFSKFGTVGCVALDKSGNLAAGTSTGGMANKMYGRVGDAPIIGAGTFASNQTCAISCTGHGEYFIRYSIAHEVSAVMEYKKFNLKDAAKFVIDEKLSANAGTGGLIGLDRNAKVVMEFNTPGMFRGYILEGSNPATFIFKDDK